MLTVYRRHTRDCNHREEGRKYRRCRCPLWVDGMLNGVEVRRSLEMRDWEKAQQKIREWEADGMPTVEQDDLTVPQACEAFKRDAVARGLEESTLKKYRVLFKQLTSFSQFHGITLVRQCDLAVLRRFRESWADQGTSAQKKLERLKAFGRFAHESGWIEKNYAKQIKSPKVTHRPTLPFTRDEVVRMLAACASLPENYGGGGSASRLRGFLLLLRYSGMRIGDVATCPVDRLAEERVFLYTQKTGVPVNVRLPRFVVEALRTMPRVSERYFFWTGEGNKDTVAGNWRRSLRRLFTLAGVAGGHPHRFRDTFAVELLLSGVPLERVSILLGHSSVKVTERHYSPWIRDRQEQLEADLERSWAADPVVLAATKGTPEVHEKKESVN